MEVKLDTRSALLKALKQAKHVYIQPRFGTSETWIRISKKETLMLLICLGTWINPVTPEALEMYSGVFGTLSPNGNGDLYLG